MLGAFGLCPLAARIGRRSLLISAPIMFGVFSLSTVYATNLQQVIMFRLLAAVGPGGAIPAFISLATEYTPRSRRRPVIALL